MNAGRTIDNYYELIKVTVVYHLYCRTQPKYEESARELWRKLCAGICCYTDFVCEVRTPTAPPLITTPHTALLTMPTADVYHYYIYNVFESSHICTVYTNVAALKWSGLHTLQGPRDAMMIIT